MDGGDTWEDVSANKGLPEGPFGRIGVSISPSQPGRVYATVEAGEPGVFRSDDYGDTWELVSDNRDLQGRPWYYQHIFADPQDADTAWVLNYSALEVDRRGEDMGRGQYAPRRQPRPLDRPPQSPAHNRGQRRRSLRQLQRRRDLLHHLQSAHRAVLPRHHRLPIPVPRVRHPAGQQRDQRAVQQPQGRHSVERLLHGRQLRERPYRRRSDRSQHRHLRRHRLISRRRRKHAAIRPLHRTGAHYHRMA